MLEWALILSFATWRITSLLFIESPFSWLRKLLGIQEDEFTETLSYPDNIIGKTFQCFWCLTLIVALALLALVYVFTTLNIFEAIMLWLAASAGAIVIDIRFFARYREQR